MDFVKALTYPFDDPDWLKKLGILLLVGLALAIPVVNIAAGILITGWDLKTAKNVKAGAANPMAGWDDFGGLFQDGLMLFLGRLLYNLPTLLFICVGLGVFFASGGAAAASDSSDTAGALASVGSLGLMCCLCLGFLFTLALNVVFAGAYIRYMDRPEFSTFTQFGENLNLVQTNISDFGMAVLYLIGGGFIGSLASATVIGGVLVPGFLTYFSSHIIGQLAAKLGGAAAPKPMM